MSFKVLFKDELRGLYTSKAMLALLVGLPVLMVVLYLITPDLGGMPLTAFTALVASSLAGTIAAVMLTVGMINEKNRKVYDLFLVRPVKPSDILLAKFAASFLFVILAVLLSIGVGVATDHFQGTTFSGEALNALGGSILLSISMIAVASAVGVVIGASVSSILVGVILVIYGGNQLVGLVAALSMNLSQNVLVQILPAMVICLVLMIVAMEVFKRRRS